MKSVLQTSLTASKKQLKNSHTTLSQRSQYCSLQALYSAHDGMKRSHGISAHEQSTSKFFIQRRQITKDSWGAEGLKAQGEILTSFDHKPNLFIDEAYMQGPPPAEVKRICDKILSMNIVDISILVKLVTTRLGYTEEMMFPEGGAGGGGGDYVEEVAVAVVAEPVVERENFDIKLTLVDPKSKIKIIKEVRALTGLGLKEAKDLVEKAPVIIKQGVKKEDIEAIKKILVDVGATIEII